MEDKNAQGADTDNLSRRNGVGDSPPAPLGITHSIRPGLPCRETVLVVVMSDGSYLLVGYPQGEPATWILAKDAGLLHWALSDAFGRGQPAASKIDEAAHPGNEPRT